MIVRLDHLVLTVRSVEATCDFYRRCLDLRPEPGPMGTAALYFGNQKINLHPAENDFVGVARRPTAGSADFCLVTYQDLAIVMERLAGEGVLIETGPASRKGAVGPMTSIYFRDPDENLVEVSRYD